MTRRDDWSLDNEGGAWEGEQTYAQRREEEKREQEKRAQARRLGEARQSWLKRKISKKHK